jgi:hypothetical protein
MKQTPETLEESVGECNKQCRHESQEDRKQQRFVSNALRDKRVTNR